MLRPTSWPCPDSGDEYALLADADGSARLLIIPALFDEGNRMRRFTSGVMRLLQGQGIGSVLPDLAGMNESLAPLSAQSLSRWQAQAAAAAEHFAATHVLTIRAGAMLAPVALSALRHAPVASPAILRGLLRARVIADKEAGRETRREALLAEGRSEGLELAGYALCAQMIAELADGELPDQPATDIPQSQLGGAGLWLRAEPGNDPAQACALATLVRKALA